jgi:hypothetical protein
VLVPSQHIVFLSFCPISYPSNQGIIVPRALGGETKAYARSTGSLEAGLSEISVNWAHTSECGMGVRFHGDCSVPTNLLIQF